ncbi:RICIN domain-containing protein [Pseudomonas fuscovaginae UPB0736]|uniref:RICIN domain-containing protein n=1 Tax=Pseudomonas asplenii TaxID=53407 RepID=UPI0012F90DE0|nr:hypothetical protein [Pseudomonas fuscovaginae]UUQ66183.1 RICIN domain-containing protein [Pseudomonas fuscovaginae UPB0736]
MNKSTDTPKPATTDQTPETLSSLAEIKTDIIVKIIPTAGLQFYLYAFESPSYQINITNNSNPPPRSLWTVHRQEDESGYYYIQSYPDSHLYMTYVESVNDVVLRAYSGNDYQKWLILTANGGEYYICTIAQARKYLSARLPLVDGTKIFTFSYAPDVYAQRFAVVVV